MTTLGGSEGSSSDGAPYLPSAQSAVPTLPPARAVLTEPAPEPEFDAAAMVASQKHYNPNPAYGEMPSGSAEGRENARKLREQANRKKRRSKAFGRVMMLIVVAALGVAGYFVYDTLKDDDTDDTATSSENSDTDTDVEVGEPPAGATPLGGLVDSLGAQEALNETASPSAGGFMGAIDDAREAVGAINGAPIPGGEAVVAVPLLESDVLPIVLGSVSTRLDDADGFERYVIDATAFEAANVGAYDRFIEVVAVQPSTDSAAFALLEPLGPEQIGLAVQRADGSLSRVVVVTADRALAVDVSQ